MCSVAQTIQLINPSETTAWFGDKQTFSLDVLVGLSEQRKSIPSKYMYDTEGSRLFQDIMALPEYYLTDCERDTLQRNCGTIASLVGDQPFNLVEFGSGDGSKTRILLNHFLDRGLNFQYAPIDISESAQENLLGDLRTKLPDLTVTGLVSDYFTGTRWLAQQTRRRNFVLFLGSSIGNFTHAEARFFLRNLWNCLNNGDYVLIGFDLKKDIELLLDAYNDPQGVTARFNLNVLNRINRQLGGDFDISRFRHFGTYDVFSGAMESYLVSLDSQEVYIREIGRSFTFRPFEPIHMEYSYKYLESDIETIARETGFTIKKHLHDAKGYFIDSVWEVVKA